MFVDVGLHALVAWLHDFGCVGCGRGIASLWMSGCMFRLLGGPSCTFVDVGLHVSRSDFEPREGPRHVSAKKCMLSGSRATGDLDSCPLVPGYWWSTWRAHAPQQVSGDLRNLRNVGLWIELLGCQGR